MKRLTVLALPMTALLTLSACAPIARGAQADYPVEQADAFTPVTVLPGQTVFVTVPYTRAVIEEDNEYDRYFDAIDFDYSSVRASGDKVPDAYRDAPWFTVKSTNAPAGITVTLVKANIGRIVTQTKLNGTSVNVKYGERFRLQYKVSVAPDYRAPQPTEPAGKTPLSTTSASRDSALASLSPDVQAMLKAYSADAVSVRITFNDGIGTKTATLRIATGAEK